MPPSEQRVVLDSGTLREKVVTGTERALARGALRPIPTSCESIRSGGIRFVVRTLSSLARKDEERWEREREAQAGREIDPFLPYDRELFVADLTTTHLSLLNKFNVMEHHLLLVTRKFEDQETYLTTDDFLAMLAVLAQYDSLAFYNGGTVAGASQRHKHLQLVPLPLSPHGSKTPVDPILEAARYEGTIGRSEGFPFIHAVSRMEPGWIRSPLASAVKIHGVFSQMLRAVGMESTDITRNQRQSGPYNFIATREWMLLVPRSREFFSGFSVNALGFAGSLLVRNEQEMSSLRKAGPMAVLEAVSVRPTG